MEHLYPTTFGALLKHYRLSRNLSQAALAERAGLRAKTISSLERGVRQRPYPDTLARLAEALKLTPEEQATLGVAARAQTIPRPASGLSVFSEPGMAPPEERVQAAEVVWSVPVHHTAVFTGREAVLEHLHTLLTQERHAVLTQAITGLGGIGKTQTALEYAHRYRQEYQAVLWAQADSQQMLVSSVITLAQVLELPQREAKEQEEIVAAFRHWLETHSTWLFILDNVEILPDIQRVLPTGSQGHVLLTTRSQAVGTLARPLPLEVLSEEEGALLLLRRAGKLSPTADFAVASMDHQDQAKALSKQLGGLPLALDQAGAYLEETGISPAEYQALFKQVKGKLLRQRGKQAADHLDSVAVTFELAFAKVQQASPAAGDLLRLCAFLAPEAIPEELFTGGSDALPVALREAVGAPLGWQDTLALLRGYSLLERQEETKTLFVHRLVQDVLCEALDAASQRQWAEQVVRLVNATFPFVEYPSWERCQRLLPHALMCAEQIQTWGLPFPEAARLLNQAGLYLHERAAYAQALPLFQRALKIDEQAYGPIHPTVATSLNNLASLYWDQGQYQLALPLFQRALAIREQALGPDHPDVAFSLNNLALLYRDQGQYQLALPLFQRALKIDEQAYGLIHPKVAIHLDNLANLYRDQGQYQLALPLCQQALAIREQALDPDHPDVAFSLNNLALLYRDQGQYDEALPLSQRALAIREQALDPDHPDVATSLNTLAELYRAQGQYEQAEPLYQRALAIGEHALGPDHPDVATILNNLAELYCAQGQYAQARPLYQRALAIREHALGPDHPKVAICLDNLAGLYQDQGQYQQALPLLQRAVTILERTQPDHPNTATCLEHLAALLCTMGHQNQSGSP